MDINQWLKVMADQDGSDLYLTTGAPPCIKLNGLLKPISRDVLQPGQVGKIARGLMDDEQNIAFAKKPEMNLALGMSGVGRFRVNIFRQRNEYAMVIRLIKTQIPTLENLGLPPQLQQIIMAKRGLVLVIGATGSGKSTTLAAMIDHRNSNAAGHIITIEDPVEYVHRHKRSLVNQREVGVDTDSYADALKNALRQAPDVILIGEIRDRETMDHAIAFAETGHLSISTLHANNANQALDRIINFFPQDRRDQLLLDLSLNLRAFISQRLLPTVAGKRVAVVEILLSSPRITDLIRRGEVEEIRQVMQKSEAQGMQTFDSAMFKLVQEGRISSEEALKNADSPNNLKLRLSQHRGIDETRNARINSLSLVDEDATTEETEAGSTAPENP